MEDKDADEFPNVRTVGSTLGQCQKVTHYTEW